MYKLTPDEIKKVCNDLYILPDKDDEYVVGYTFEQAKDNYYEMLGDAPFEFEDTFISNPLIDITGRWLYLNKRTSDDELIDYEKACDYYGEENVNNYFGKYIEHNYGYEPELDTDSILEALKSKVNPIYKDNKYNIYHFDNIHQAYADTNLKDKIDNINWEEDCYIISSKVVADDDFVSDDDAVIVLNASSPYDIYVWSNCVDDYHNEYIESLDELKSYLGYESDTWKYINDNILKNYLFDKANVNKNGIIEELIIPMISLKPYIRNKNINREISANLIKEFLSDDYPHLDYSYVYGYDLPDHVIDSISRENKLLIKELYNINENKLEQILKNNFDDEHGITKSVYEALAVTLEQTAYANLLSDILNGIKDCFPGYFSKYLDLSNTEFKIINCPKEIFSRLIDEYIDEYESTAYLDELYRVSLDRIFGSYIENLSVKDKEEYGGSYDEFDPDTFNEILAEKISVE